MKVNERATNITGTVARPSRPSVRFTALDDPIITKSANGIKNNPICKIKFLKKGKYKLYKYWWSENWIKIYNAISAIINWPKNFNFEFKPLEFLRFIFNRSSIKPKTPRLKNTKIRVQINTFDKSA